MHASGDRIAASLQAGADGASIRIRARAPLGGALIELLLRHLRLFLCVRIGGRTDDRAGRAANQGTGACMRRAADDGTDDGAATAPPTAPTPAELAGCTITADRRASPAGIHTGLLYRPHVAFVTIALGLLRALTMGGIDEHPLRRRCRHASPCAAAALRRPTTAPERRQRKRADT